MAHFGRCLRVCRSSSNDKKLFVRGSDEACCLPVRVNGWHGGDIVQTSAASFSKKLLGIDSISRDWTATPGKLWLYTSFATVLMSNAAVTSVFSSSPASFNA